MSSGGPLARMCIWKDQTHLGIQMLLKVHGQFVRQDNFGKMEIIGLVLYLRFGDENKLVCCWKA